MPRRVAWLLLLVGVASGTREREDVIDGIDAHSATSEVKRAEKPVSEWDEEERKRANDNMWEFMALSGFDFSTQDPSLMTVHDNKQWLDRWKEFQEEHKSRQRAMGLADELLKNRLPNADRIQCLRSDELDLMMPSSDEFILRKALGGEGGTGWDVYLNAKGIWIKNLFLRIDMTRTADEVLTYRVGDRVRAKLGNDWKKAIITAVSDSVFTILFDEVDDEGNKIVFAPKDVFKRMGELKPLGKAFDIIVTGNSQLDEEDVNSDSDLAELSFELQGLTPLFRSSLMSTGLRWLSNADTLTQSQHGSLKFKLAARAIGTLNHATGLWEVQLLDKKLSPFKIDLSNQQLINTALSAFGSSIEGIVIDGIWSQLHQIIPRSFAALTSELAAEELEIAIGATISGRQVIPGGLLELEVDIDNTIDQNPKVLLDALVAKFDVKTLVDGYFRALIEEQNLKAMWSVNKDAVAAMLSRYGVDLSDWVSEDFNEEAIKQKLLDAATRTSDAVIQAMKPFMTARERGLLDPFEGVAAHFSANVNWDAQSDLQGRTTITLGDRKQGTENGGANQLSLPRNFHKALTSTFGDEIQEMVVAPRNGDPPSIFSLQDLTYDDTRLRIGGMRVSRVRLSSPSEFNETVDGVVVKTTKTRQTWKMTGGLTNVDLQIPKAWDKPWSVTFAGTDVKFTSAGTVNLEMNSPLIMKQKELHSSVNNTGDEVQGVPAKPRSGATEDIMGPVPQGFARPTVKSKQLAQLELAPELDTRLTVGLKSKKKKNGEDSHLVIKVSGSLDAKLDVNRLVKLLAAGRPTDDTGYMFFAGEFELRFFKPDLFEPQNLGRQGKKYKVVLNCGYVRLLQSSNFGKGNNDIVTFDNFDNVEKGQFEIKLNKDSEVPKVTNMMLDAGLRKCLVIGTRDYKGWLGWYKEKPMLCAATQEEAQQLQQLQEALQMQVWRFQNNPEETDELNFGTHRRYDRAGNEQPQYQLPPGLGTQDLTKLLKLR